MTSLQLKKSDQSEIPIRDLPQDIDIILANDNAALPSPLLPSIDRVTNQTLYAFNWTNSNSSVLIQVDPYPDSVDHDPDLEMNSDQLEIKICVQFDVPPNRTHNGGCTHLPQEAADFNSTIAASTSMSPYSWLLQPDDLQDVGMYYVTIDTVQNLEAWHNHTVYAYSTQCLYWDEEAEEWDGGGCKVSKFQFSFLFSVNYDVLKLSLNLIMILLRRPIILAN